ncbi:hypothetical protein BDY19DRAFT_940386 [Irpex rosettiformis]|uniref:Uncharacterized protein n=1 Tax=Irpex rosettiformis TaxID=378272 RepID=A0ACB8U875_9APHY|nr:hypothetical protein BDY19DRAFT_940386 [Irpex rosettiformis]
MKLSHFTFLLFTLLLVTLSTVTAAPVPAPPSSPAKQQSGPPTDAQNQSAVSNISPPNAPGNKTAPPSVNAKSNNKDTSSNGKSSDSKSENDSSDDPKTNDAFCFGCLGGSPGMGAPHFDGHLFGGGGLGFGGFRGGR